MTKFSFLAKGRASNPGTIQTCTHWCYLLWRRSDGPDEVGSCGERVREEMMPNFYIRIRIHINTLTSIYGASSWMHTHIFWLIRAIIVFNAYAIWRLCNILLKLVSTISSNMHYSYGDKNGTETAHIVFPVSSVSFFSSNLIMLKKLNGFVNLSHPT